MLMALCVLTLASRRTRRTSLPLISALTMRYMGQGQGRGKSPGLRTSHENLNLGH